MLRSLMVFAAIANGRLRRLTVRRKLEDACWHRSHAHCCHWHANRTPSWSSDLHGRYFAWNRTIPVVILATVVTTTATLCRQTHARVQVFFRCILLPFYRNSSPGTTRFLGKRTVSYKRAVALRNSRLVCRLPLFFCHAYGYLPNCRTSPRFGWYQIILLGTEACVGASNSPRVVTQLHPSWESNPRPLRHMCCTTTKLRSAVNPDKICYIKIFSTEQNYVCLLLCPRPLGGALSDDAVWRLSVCRVHRA